MTQEEIVNYFIQTMQAHAEPRNYDWLIFGVAIGGIFVSLCAIYFTYRIYKKQTEIAERQTDILEQQNRIALFEKRYELYKFFRQLKINISVVPLERLIQGLSTPRPKFNKVMLSIGVLFDQIVNFNSDDLKNCSDEEEQLEKTQGKLLSALNEFGMVKYVFVLNEKELSKINKIQDTLVDIWFTATEEEQLIKNKEDLLPLQELSSILISLEKQLYLVNPTLNPS